MKKKIVVAFAVIACVLVLLISIFSIFTQNIFTEKIGEKQEISSIQELINAATPKDTIQIPIGTYYEKIIIDKPLTLMGENNKEVVIDGSGAENVVYITADDVELVNITIRNSGGYKDNAGIKIVSDNNLIKNCILYRTKTGIYFDKTKNTLVTNCLFHTNGEGVYFGHSLDNIIENCEFQHNSFGLHLFNSEGTTIKNSYIHTNGLGIYGKSSDSIEIEKCAISDNSQDGGGIWFFGCGRFVITDCNINHNGVGLEMLKTSDSKVTNCNFYGNMYKTILLEISKDVYVAYCDIRDSFRTAFSMRHSDYCVFHDNNIIGSQIIGIECKGNSNCNARDNWWGSKFGPSLTAFGPGEKVSLNPLKIKVYPWKKGFIDNIGASWSTKDVFTKTPITHDRFKQTTFEEEDSDEDGVPDFWEDTWGYDPYSWNDHSNLDPDNDGLNNIEECYTYKYGSNPYYKDIFIEVDWLETSDLSLTNKPPFDLIEKAVNIFKEHEIALHIDTGNFGGGEEIPMQAVTTCAEFRDLYWDYFLKNDLDNPRKGIFRYVLIVNEIEELWNGFSFVGWDHLDVMGMAIQSMQNNNQYTSRGQLIVGGIIHELGHTMGLLIDDHGGIDNSGFYNIFSLQAWKYTKYKSCLNYQYTYRLFTYSDGTHGLGDFDDWSNLDFSFFKNTDFERV